MSEKGKHIKLDNNPKLAANVFQVPEGYFNSLSDRLMNNSKSELLQSEKLKQLPFEVPANYFETLTDQIMEKALGSETKVIPITRQLWFRITAVAASLVLVASFYFLLPQNSLVDHSLTDVSNDTIIEYLNAQQHSQDNLFDGLDSIELVLDDIIAEELNVFADVLSTNTELNYDFEYFDY